MGLARVVSAVVVGVQAQLVEVEVHISSGLPGLVLVGLPDAAVNESRDRVRAAIVNSGLRWPDTRITVGLSPAWLPKRGPGLDLAIALAVLVADRQLPAESLEQVLALGELGLDGRIRPVSGALAAALAARQHRLSGFMTGKDDASQADLVAGLEVTGSATLRSMAARLRGDEIVEVDNDENQYFKEVASDPKLPMSDRSGPAESQTPVDLAEVRGQPAAKRALEVAAAGGHHLALLGPAGVGKTLLAERYADLLPDLDETASLEVTAIHQLAGYAGRRLMRRPPYQAPHHTASRVAMVGGGSENKPSIGLISLAHRGVLFLDEAAEFEPHVLDALREPMDSGTITVSRAGFQVMLPAAMQLVIATNPCPCGGALEVGRSVSCRCTPAQRRRYLGRLSGPLLDRIDVRVALARPTLAQLSQVDSDSQTTAQVAARVVRARAAAANRKEQWGSGEGRAYSLELERNLANRVKTRLNRACVRESLRGRDRVMRVMWTLADLEGRNSPEPADVEEALVLRVGDGVWAAA